jgi:2-iminoacetate synthase ThiH
MKIRIIRQRATKKESQEMLEELETYIKLAIDVERGILAGGGEYHADCEEALLEDGSRQEDIWGADWYPESKKVEFIALINIRPRQGNRGMEIEDPNLRAKVEAIVRRLLDVEST